MEKKKCFVLTPIGEDNSDIREHADAVIEQMIKPVMKNYDVLAAHHICNTGIITEQIMQEIAESDIVIANLTTCNPNVMYELALRHCTGKPVIMIAKAETDIPFDLSHHRVIWYTTDFTGLEPFKKELRETLQNVEARNNHYDFQEVLTMLGRAYGMPIGKMKNLIDSVYAKIGTDNNPPVSIVKKKALEDNFSLQEREQGARQIRLVNYAGTSFLANDKISTCYDREWEQWFKKALAGGVHLDLVLTKPNTAAAQDAERYKMYPSKGLVEDKRNLILRNYEAIEEFIKEQPGLKVIARFTDIALPYALFETIFQDDTKNHIKVDLYSPLTQNDNQRPSFMVYNSRNPELYEHFSTVINHIIDVSEEMFNTVYSSKRKNETTNW